MVVHDLELAHQFPFRPQRGTDLDPGPGDRSGAEDAVEAGAGRDAHKVETEVVGCKKMFRGCYANFVFSS